MTRAIVFDSESPDIIELRKEFEEKFGSTEVFDYFYINLRNRIAKDTMKAMIEGQNQLNGARKRQSEGANQSVEKDNIK